MSLSLPSFRSYRHAVGLSQVQLAAQSGVSLATLQAIEAGQGNPEWDTIQRLGQALGFEVALSPVRPDWNLLIRAGVPLGEDMKGKRSPSRTSEVLREWDRAWQSKPSEREREALQAFALALHDHFPTLFASRWTKSSAVEEALRLEVTGRVIKLRRIAISLIARGPRQ